MSQGEDHRAKPRAILAIVAVCALVFGLFAAVGTHASARAGLHGFMQSAGVFCHDLDADSAVSDHAPDRRGPTKQISCPCCLAAHAGPAVLPERFALLLRQAPAATLPVYRSSPKSLPHFALRQLVNGARAPPFGASLA